MKNDTHTQLKPHRTGMRQGGVRLAKCALRLTSPNNYFRVLCSLFLLLGKVVKTVCRRKRFAQADSVLPPISPIHNHSKRVVRAPRKKRSSPEDGVLKGANGTLSAVGCDEVVDIMLCRAHDSKMVSLDFGNKALGESGELRALPNVFALRPPAADSSNVFLGVARFDRWTASLGSVGASGGGLCFRLRGASFAAKRCGRVADFGIIHFVILLIGALGPAVAKQYPSAWVIQEQSNIIF
jgi:hypothetical protein